MSDAAEAWAGSLDAGSPGANLVLRFLATEADDEHSCSPGRDVIAAAAGMGVRSVARHMAALQKAGLIQRRARPRADGRGRDPDLLFLAVPAEFRAKSPVTNVPNWPVGQGQCATNVPNWPVGPRPLTASFSDLSQSQNLPPPGSPPKPQTATVARGRWAPRAATLDALPGPLGPDGCDDWERADQHPECRRVAGLILNHASSRATHPLTPTERNRLHRFVVEWIQAGYAPEAIADATAAAPAKTEPSIGFELRRRARPRSVGADTVDVARRWMAQGGPA